jgi:hypothetical protein
MPISEGILGFSNRWYRAAMETAETLKLAPDLEIRVVTAPFFLATKLGAFRGRGRGDFFGSRDLEDLIAVIDGRDTVVTEIEAGSADLRAYIRGEIQRLLSNPSFLDALPGFLPPDQVSQSRIGIVLRRLQQLASL